MDDEGSQTDESVLTTPLRRLWERLFVFTLLWVGFILAISFLATPLKFLAPSLTLPVAMEIAYLVFHTFNGIEIALALLILAITFLAGRSRKTRRITALIVSLLATQTALLYTVMDARTLAIIDGAEPTVRSYHAIYVGLEVVKLAGLLYLANLQLKEHEAELRYAASNEPGAA